MLCEVDDYHDNVDGGDVQSDADQGAAAADDDGDNGGGNSGLILPTLMTLVF